MTWFRAALNSSSLREIPLIGRRFTWSNEQSPPTLVHLDRAFCNIDWELRFPAAKLLPQATAMSDHSPLLLVNEGLIKKPRRFRFEEYWRFLDGFKEVVIAARNLPVGSTDPINAINLKLRRVGKALSTWSKCSVGNVTMQFDMVHDLTPRLDMAQESRPLSLDDSALLGRPGGRWRKSRNAPVSSSSGDPGVVPQRRRRLPTQAPPSRRCRRLCPRWRRAPFPKGRGFSGCSLYAAQIRRWGGGHGSSRRRRPAVVLDDATAGSGSGMVLRLAAWATSGRSLRAELCASCGPSA